MSICLGESSPPLKQGISIMNITNNYNIYKSTPNYVINQNNESSSIINSLNSRNSNIECNDYYKKFFNNVKKIILGDNVEIDIKSDLDRIINEIEELIELKSKLESKRNNSCCYSEIKFSIFSEKKIEKKIEKKKFDYTQLHVCRAAKGKFIGIKKIEININKNFWNEYKRANVNKPKERANSKNELIIKENRYRTLNEDAKKTTLRKNNTNNNLCKNTNYDNHKINVVYDQKRHSRYISEKLLITQSKNNNNNNNRQNYIINKMKEQKLKSYFNNNYE